jgi:DNA-binding response OmpR family regulator
MPGLTGPEVCAQLRASDDAALRKAPIVLLTARSALDDTSAGFTAGATDFLTKPFSPALVRSRVRGWLLRAQTAAVEG